jgi:hypothetical protein
MWNLVLGVALFWTFATSAAAAEAHHPVVDNRHVQPEVPSEVEDSSAADEPLVDVSPQIGTQVDEIYKELMTGYRH